MRDNSRRKEGNRLRSIARSGEIIKSKIERDFPRERMRRLRPTRRHVVQARRGRSRGQSADRATCRKCRWIAVILHADAIGVAPLMCGSGGDAPVSARGDVAAFRPSKPENAVSRDRFTSAAVDHQRGSGGTPALHKGVIAVACRNERGRPEGHARRRAPPCSRWRRTRIPITSRLSRLNATPVAKAGP